MSRTPGILAVNAGSSSLKFALYPVTGGAIAPAGRSGLIEGLEPGGRPVLRLKGQDAATPLDAVEGRPGFETALHALLEVVAQDDSHLLAVAHRIVHGGSRFAASTRLDDEVLDYLTSLEPLAPLHQPHNLSGVRALRRASPAVPQVACFDTAFHATVPEVEQRFALPEPYFEAGVRRYGFHGLSYRYVSQTLARRCERANGRLLVAHLGNGASLCAIRAGRSVATTMGFSALDGLMMGSRCGAIDAGVLLHLLRQGRNVAELETLLYRQSGLLGVSGLSADMRTLRASDAAAAARAIGLFTHRIVRESGAMAACLGGLDVLAFTGGIGEHDAQLRADVCAALGFLGVRLDEARNRAAAGDGAAALHAADSAVEIWVVPTDEGRVAASDALALVS